jgi:SpoIID/LytB domain protein
MKYILFIFMMMGCFSLTAAHIHDGGLYLDILIKYANQTTIYSDHEVKVEQLSLPISYQLMPPIKISLTHSEVSDYYTFLIKTTPVGQVDTLPDEDNTYKEVSKNTWENGKLHIRHFFKIYDSRTFPTYEAAAQVAKAEKRSLKTIEKLSYPNNQVEVRDLSGELRYFELPIQISGKDGLHLDGDPDGYAGNLVLKPAGKVVRIINDIELEEYLMGVVPNEIGDNAPLEALKAQAVAARSETVSNLLFNRHIDDSCDLCNTTHCQVYKGYFIHQSNIEEAVLDTAGEVLVCDSLLVDAVYGSSCGGWTEENQYAWKGKSLPYLKSVPCEPGAENYDLMNNDDAIRWIDRKVSSNGSSWEKRANEWERSISRAKLEKNSGVDNIENIIVKKRGKSGRIILLEIKGSNRSITLDSEYKIRQVFGGLPSSCFYLTGSGTYIIKGKGAGHGVGMCQVGALRRAREGMSYRDILHFYFTNSELYTDWME